MDEKTKTPNTFLVMMLLSCSLAVIAVSFYYFYFKKDFEFIVEVSCDPTLETCFQRDCTNPDDCPPNGLSNFKRYTLSAADFPKCEKEDCTAICESESVKCEQVECTEDLEVGESCNTGELPEISE